MVLAVDFDFIHKLEGARVLKGYVPNPEGSASGVTIASGVDLGQRSERSLRGLAISVELVAKLRPYLGRKKQAAVSLLAEKPLEITMTEAKALDAAVRRAFLDALVARFDPVSDTPFANLDSRKQTVVASVAFQYGVGLDQRTPNFWKQVTSGQWTAALANLRNFGDAYRTRRHKEADLLAEVVPTAG